jgi:uncharacterized protein
MPERMCIVTREVKDEARLIRFARSPDGIVVPDLLRKLPGRGVWLSLERGKLDEAVRKNMFTRGFGEATTVPPSFSDTISEMLRKQAISVLSLARKAGEALAGFMKVDEAMRKGPVKVLLHASGASLDGCEKLNRLAKPDALVFGHFSTDELSLAFGRSNVIHAAVARGNLADKLVFHVHRWAEYDGLTLGQIGQ